MTKDEAIESARETSCLLLVLTLLLRALLLLLLLVLGLVHLVEQGQGSSLELVDLLLELLGGGGAFTRLVLGNELAESGNLLADRISLSLVQAVLEVREGLLGIVQDAVSAVGSLNGSLAGLVGLAVLLSLVNHVLDLGIRETRAGSNGDGLVLVGGLVLGVDVDNGVGIDVEGDLNLGNTTVGRGNANQLEVTEHLVVLDELTLTLVDLDLDSGLHVGSGGEGLGLLGGDCGVTVDQTGEDTTQSLDTQGEGSNIEQENVGNLTSQDGTLNSGTNGNSLVGVDRLGGLTAEHGLDGLGDLRHTGHTTNQDDILDVAGLQVGILQSFADRLLSTGDQGIHKSLELSTRHLLGDVKGTTGTSADELFKYLVIAYKKGFLGSTYGKRDLSLQGRRQLNLGLLSSLTDTLDGHAIVGQVDTSLLLEVLNNVADQSDIEVLTTQVSVTVGGLDLEDTLLDLQNGDIESTATKIVDGDHTVSLLLETVGEGSSSGLVNNTENVQTGNLTGILGGLTLGVVEVSGNGNNGILNGLAKVGLSGLLHLVEDETTNLGRRVLLATGLNPGIAVGVLNDLVGNLLDVTLNFGIGELATNETLGSKESVLRVDDGLTLSGNTDETLAILGETDNGGSCAGTCRKSS